MVYSHGHGHYLQPVQHFELCPFSTSCNLRAEKAPASLWALGTAQCNHHPFSSISNIKRLRYSSSSAGKPGINK